MMKTIPGEAVKLHKVVDLLLGSCKQVRVWRVLRATSLNTNFSFL
jgi:hypothetical protein